MGYQILLNFEPIVWVFSQHGPEAMMAIAFAHHLSVSVGVVVYNCGSFCIIATLPQYISENSVEPLDIGETLKF